MGYLHAECQVPVPMHKEEAYDRSEGGDFVVRNSAVSIYKNVIKKLKQ